MSAGPYSVTRVTPGVAAQMVLAVIVIATPILWIVLSSLKASQDVTAYPPRLIFAPTLANYLELFERHDFLSFGLNSLIVAAGSTLLGLLLGVPMAFAVSYKRLTWPATAVLIARMAPGTLFLLPESATMDGATPFAIFGHVALPLVKPGMVVATILAFVFSWNYFLFALVLSGFRSKTMIVAAFNFVGEGVSAWGALMAASVVIALPPLLLALFVQRWLIAGLTGGAVKG